MSRNHLRKMNDLRLYFKYALANQFFSKPIEFLDCLKDGSLIQYLQNFWSDFVKSEHSSPEAYSTEFDYKFHSNEENQELFILISMPDIINMNEPKLEYKWHSSIGVGYVLYFNFKEDIVRYFVCESSMASSMDNACLEGKYVPIYFVVEFGSGARTNLGNFGTNSTDEAMKIFFNAVVSIIEGPNYTN